MKRSKSVLELAKQSWHSDRFLRCGADRKGCGRRLRGLQGGAGLAAAGDPVGKGSEMCSKRYERYQMKVGLCMAAG